MEFLKNNYQTILYAIIATSLSWFINHELGFGSTVGSGVVGILAAIFLPAGLASTSYIASFVGMSSVAIIPTFSASLLGGLIVGIVMSITREIYVGIGGKGGTTAAFSTIVTRTILNLFS